MLLSLHSDLIVPSQSIKEDTPFEAEFARRYCGMITPPEAEWLRRSCGICIQNGGMSESKIWDFIYDHDGYKIGITYGDVERDIEIARAHQEKGDFSITRKKFDIFQKSIPAQSINENIIENPTNNNVFVIEKKVPLKQDIFAIIGRIEGNLTIRPNTKMQINTFLGEKLNVNILGIKWDGRMRQEIGGGSDIMLSVSGISIDSVDIGDELTL